MREAAMDSPGKRTVFVVQSYHWEYNDEHYQRGGDAEPVKGFTRRERAEAYWFAEERAAWLDVHDPAAYAGGLDMATSLSEEEVIGGLARLGFPVEPPLGWMGYDVGGWHRDDSPFSPEQFRGLWKLFDKIRFHEIVEVELAADEEGRE
jgi:hypothetical protein